MSNSIGRLLPDNNATHDATSDQAITHCAACHRPFRPRQKWTIAAWHKCGTIPLSAIVHIWCRDKMRPDSRRAR